MTTPGDLRQRRTQATRLGISEVAIDLFATKGLASTTVDEISAAAGVSVRTFHRYFRTKAEAITPVLDVSWQQFITALAADGTTAGLVDWLIGGFTLAAEGGLPQPHRQFIVNLPKLPELEPFWLQIHADAQRALIPVLAPRLDADPDDPNCAFIASVIVNTFRVAVEANRDDPSMSTVDLARRFLTILDGYTCQLP